MHPMWGQVAERIADALGARDGELIQVRDRAGRYDVLQEILLALERRGATPLPELLPGTYLTQLLATTSPAILSRWDRHRIELQDMHHRSLVLAGMSADHLDAAPRTSLDAWQQAVERLTVAEQRRLVPYLLVAVPTEERARAMRIKLEELEELSLPGMAASPIELQREIDRILPALVTEEGEGRELRIRTGSDCDLRADLGDRRWLTDNGVMPSPTDLAEGVQAVQNLPAGAVYTTLVETSAEGSLFLPRAGEAREVLLRFDKGGIVSIEAVSGAEALEAMFDQHDGAPRRISHLGVGLNPRLSRVVDWVLVDEHRHGSLLIAFGENRYLGGNNASSLNVDFVIPEADLFVNGHPIVQRGHLYV